MKIINLTPHAVTINKVTFPPSGQIARVATINTLSGNGPIILDNTIIPVFTQSCGEVYGLPEPEFSALNGSTFFLVSSMVRLAVPSRLDVISPGDLIRDFAGQPIGCTGVIANKPI